MARPNDDTPDRLPGKPSEQQFDPEIKDGHHVVFLWSCCTETSKKAASSASSLKKAEGFQDKRSAIKGRLLGLVFVNRLKPADWGWSEVLRIHPLKLHPAASQTDSATGFHFTNGPNLIFKIEVCRLIHVGPSKPDPLSRHKKLVSRIHAGTVRIAPNEKSQTPGGTWLNRLSILTQSD